MVTYQITVGDVQGNVLFRCFLTHHIFEYGDGRDILGSKYGFVLSKQMHGVSAISIADLDMILLVHAFQLCLQEYVGIDQSIFSIDRWTFGNVG